MTTDLVLTRDRLRPLEEAFKAEVLSSPAMDYLRAPQFEASLTLWAQAQAKVELLSQWVDSMPIEQAANSARGQTSPMELLRKWMNTAQSVTQRLGLDPLSAARLGKDVAQGRQTSAAVELSLLRAAHEAAAQRDAHGDTDHPSVDD